MMKVYMVSQPASAAMRKAMHASYDVFKADEGYPSPKSQKNVT